MVGSAYLRIFQPLDALPDAERERVERAILRREPHRRAPNVYRHLGSAGGSLGLLQAIEDHAEIRNEAGRWYACPSRSRLRVLAAMLSLRDTAPDEVAEAFVPEIEARRAARELARIRKRDPSAVPTMLESPWHVPVRWFVLFEDPERRLTETDRGYSLTYWTSLEQARRRAQRAAGVLERGDLRPVAAMVHEIDDWLSSFRADAAVELDYGDVAAGSTWNDLEEDHSARELQEALDALEEGYLERASDLYRTVATRWAEAKIRESLN